MEPICAVLECASSTYWAAKKHEAEPSARAVRDEQLKKEIMRVWKGPGRRVYGARKVWTYLNRIDSLPADCQPDPINRLNVRRHQRLGGILSEYENAV